MERRVGGDGGGRWAWRQAALPYAVVAGTAILARLLVAISSPFPLYFPDSWCYAPRLGTLPCAAHDPAITTIWRLLSLDQLSESSVLMIQAVLGIASAVLLLKVLRRISSPSLSLAAALLFSVLPLQLLFEHMILTEATEVFCVVVFFAAVEEALRASSPVRLLLLSAISALAAGTAAAVHSSFIAPAAALWALSTALIAWRAWSTAGALRRGWLLAVLPLLSLAMLLGPALPEAASYHRHYGVWTTNALAGPFLAARWAPLLSCDPPAGATPEAAAAIALFCRESSYGTPPGINERLVWSPALGGFTLARNGGSRARYARTDAQLQAAAIAGITAHPLSFASEMLSSLGFQLLGSPWTDLQRYNAGYRYAPGSPNARDFPDPVGWFGTTEPRPRGPVDQGLLRLVGGTTRIPPLLVWIAILGGAWRLGRAGRRSHRDPDADYRLFPLKPPATRVAIGILAAAQLVVSMLTVAFAGWDIFRYWAPLVPGLLILCVLVLPRARGRHRPAVAAAELDRDAEAAPAR